MQRQTIYVVPASAGMSPFATTGVMSGGSRPRQRGDEPDPALLRLVPPESSPPARG